MSAAEADPSPKPSYARISAFGLALLVALSALIWAEPIWNQRLQAAWFDSYQMLKPRAIVATPVTVVEIDEKSLARFGQWPWPRTVLAELVRDIERRQPLAVGIDIVMPEPDRLSPQRLLMGARQGDALPSSRQGGLPSSDMELGRAIAAGPVVLALAGTPEHTERAPQAPPFMVVDRSKGAHPATVAAANLPRYAGVLTNIAELDSVAAGHGIISAGPSDDVIRRIPLAVRIGDNLVPSMPIEMLRVAFRAADVRLFVDGPSVETIAVGDFVAPTEADGELRIYYSKRDPRRSVSAVDVLDGKVDPASFQNKLVLIGTTGIATADYQNTPLGERMPGSEILAQVLENFYEQTWLSRPRWAPMVEVTVFMLLGLALIWATPRWAPGSAALLALGCIAVPILAGIAAFLWRRLVFDAAAPALGLLVLFSVLLVLTLAEASRQRRRLERVVQVQREQAAYIAGELQAAKRIQTGFLPRVDAMHDGRIELAVLLIPAREVGGDLYDFFPLDADRLFFLIGDVAGKGLSASMFMAVSKALYKSITLRNPLASVSELMRAANDEVSRDNPEMFFVTAFAGVLDLHSGALDYCNAGHGNPYLLRAGRGDLLQLTDGAGPPLCTVEGFAYRSGERRLEPGELLCLVTDGVLDAQNPAGERYGSERLQAVLARTQERQMKAHVLIDALRTNVRAFAAGAEPADDLTVLALRWLGPRGAGA